MAQACTNAGTRRDRDEGTAWACLRAWARTLGVDGFLHVGVNVETSDRHVGRRSDGPSEGVAKLLVLKTLNLPAVVTN